jgi:protein kinase-like protein
MASPEELDLGQTIRGFKSGQKIFRRYSLVRILGRGGMGVVWLAKDEELERDVALKFLPDLVVHDLAVLDELKRETRRSLQLTHHNIVRIHDFVQDAESACISMEYVDGPTLSALRVEQPSRVFEPEQLAPWVEQICEALQYAHQHARIVHRDIKPANLMLNGKRELKVADFGIARSLSDSVSMLTMARGASGTLAYMSPQQLDGERASNLDDIYSLGATLYELATSKPPFHSGGIERLIREKTPVSLAGKREELGVGSNNRIPGQWEQTIAACLAKERVELSAKARAHVFDRRHLGEEKRFQDFLGQGAELEAKRIEIRVRFLILASKGRFGPREQKQILDGDEVTHLLDGDDADRRRRRNIGCEGQNGVEIFHQEGVLDLGAGGEEDLRFFEKRSLPRDDGRAQNAKCVEQRVLSWRGEGDVSTANCFGESHVSTARCFAPFYLSPRMDLSCHFAAKITSSRS